MLEWFLLSCEWLSHISVTTVTGFVPVRYVLTPNQMFLKQTECFVSCELRLKKDLSIRWSRLWILWRLVTWRAGGQASYSYIQAWSSPVHVFLLYNILHLAERHKIKLGSVRVISELKPKLKCPVQVDTMTVLVTWCCRYAYWNVWDVREIF